MCNIIWAAKNGYLELLNFITFFKSPTDQEMSEAIIASEKNGFYYISDFLFHIQRGYYYADY